MAAFSSDPWTMALQVYARSGQAFERALRDGDAPLMLEAMAANEAAAAAIDDFLGISDFEAIEPGTIKSVQHIDLRAELLIDAAQAALEIGGAEPRALLDRAIENCRSALAPLLAHLCPRAWARGCLNLSAAYIRRNDDGRADANLAAHAAMCVMQAAGPEQFPDLWLKAIVNLSHAMLGRTEEPYGARVEWVIDLLSNVAIEEGKRDHPDAAALLDLVQAQVHTQRLLGRPSDNYANALAAADRVVDHARRRNDDELLVGALRARATSLHHRPLDNREESIDAALATWAQALEIAERRDYKEHGAAIHHDRGLALQVRIRGVRADNLRDAQQSFERALQHWLPRGGTKVARTYLNLANVERQRAQDGLPWSLDRALDWYERAFHHARGGSDDQLIASIHMDRASAYAASGEASNLAAAARDCVAATGLIDPTTATDRYARSKRVEAAIAFKRRIWPEALAAFDASLAAYAGIAGRGLDATELRRAARDLQGVGAMAAACAIRLGDLEGAVERLELCKAQELASALSLWDRQVPVVDREEARRLRAEMHVLDQQLEAVDLKDRGSILVDLKVRRDRLEALVPRQRGSTMESLAKHPDICFALPVIGSDASFLLLVEGGPDHRTSCHPLPDGLEAHINNSLVEWLSGFRPESDEAGDDFLDRRQRALFSLLSKLEVVSAPILEALEAQNWPDGAPLVLVLPGRLAVLPLAWAGDTKSLASRYAVSLAPSLASFGTSCWAEDADHGLTAIANPDGTLLLAELQAELTAAMASRMRQNVLVGDAATRRSVDDALKRSTIWLFASHAWFCPEEPRRSSIALASGDELSVGDLLAEGAGFAPRMVILSACESAIHELDATPDEFFGLPGALMQTGAHAVIANMWPVSDTAEALLSSRFAQHCLGERRAPAESLRLAQYWLRNATGHELADWLSEFRPALADAAARTCLQLAGELRSEPELRPYKDPYFWAGAVVYGC